MTQKLLFSYCPVAILYISKTNSEDEILPHLEYVLLLDN